jgi:acyl carrier protein
MIKSDFKQRYFRVVEGLLIRSGIPSKKLKPEASLKDDLKLSSNDYFFLKVDIEEFLRRPIDLDLIFESKTISDLVSLIVKIKGGTAKNHR